MTNDLTIFRAGGAVAPAAEFKQVQGYEGKLSAGIGESFASIRYKAGRWAIKYQGEVTPLVRRSQLPNGQIVEDGPEPYLDCVIIDVADHYSKYFYEGRYQEGDNKAPDCFSSNGIKPDAGAPKKQCATCVACQWNAWGSKITLDGTPSRGKQCTDHKRLVIVPVADIENKTYGGPMLLQVPPTSLAALKPYEQKLAQAGFRFFEVWTRISFDQQSAYPLFVYDAMAPLNSQQAVQVIAAQDNPLIDRILNTEIVGVDDGSEPVPSQVNQPAPMTPAPMTPPQTQVQQPAPLTPPAQDNLAIPEHLRRTTAPQAQPVTQPAAAPTPPAAQPQASLTRPPGMTDVEWNQYQEFVKSRAAATAAPPAAPTKPSRSRSRSQPVTPQPTTEVAQPQPMTPQPVTAQGNGATPPSGVSDDAAAKIGEALKTLV